MTDETIVAVFDTAEHAATAMRDLEASGVPGNAIQSHAGALATGSAGGATMVSGDALSGGATGMPVREQGFWASLFGGEPEHEHDTTVYDRSLEAGSTVVTVRAPEQHLTTVMDILERHNPVDIDERAAGYGVSGTSTLASDATLTGSTMATGTTASMGSNAATTGVETTRSQTAGIAPTGVQAGNAETLQLSEEQIAVGKRAVNRGTTRVRRYVVETPFEEQVALREETVTIDRRPVTDGRPVTGADFTDKVIEVTETAEEAIVSKTSRVKEEVVINKSATERTETIRDTVHREDVEIVKEPVADRVTTTTTTNVPTDPAKRPI